ETSCLNRCPRSMPEKPAGCTLGRRAGPRMKESSTHTDGGVLWRGLCKAVAFTRRRAPSIKGVLAASGPPHLPSPPLPPPPTLTGEEGAGFRLPFDPLSPGERECGEREGEGGVRG